jgi:parallel beta-helix repeat protein
VIGTDDITLDLNGHTIDGDNALVDPCPVGIANDGHNGVRITNGTVQEFALGVILFGARTNGLSHLSTFENVLSGILLAETVRTRVRESSSARNAGPDSGIGITLFRSHNNRIARNTAVDNAELGIHLIQSDHNQSGTTVYATTPRTGSSCRATATGSSATGWCETPSRSHSSRTTLMRLAMWCVTISCVALPAAGLRSTLRSSAAWSNATMSFVREEAASS